eukprot:gene33512-41358_t
MSLEYLAKAISSGTSYTDNGFGDYYQLLTVLQERSLLNRDQSQYPTNPFHIRDEADKMPPAAVAVDHSILTTMSPKHAQIQPVVATSEPVVRTWSWFVDTIYQTLNDDQRAHFNGCTKPKRVKKKISFSNSDSSDEDSAASPNPNLIPIKPQFKHNRHNKNKLSRIGVDETIPEESESDQVNKTPTSTPGRAEGFGGSGSEKQNSSGRVEEETNQQSEQDDELSPQEAADSVKAAYDYNNMNPT